MGMLTHLTRRAKTAQLDLMLRQKEALSALWPQQALMLMKLAALAIEILQPVSIP